MSKKIKLEDIIDVAIEQINNGGVFTFCPSGKSMEPFIDGGDTVTISKPDNLKLYDIVLCKNNHNQFILHRIVRIHDDGSFSVCGDNQLLVEKIGKENLCVGKVVSYVHKGKTVTKIDHLKARIWNQSLLFRKLRRYIKEHNG